MLDKLNARQLNSLLADALLEYQRREKQSSATNYQSEDGIVAFVREVIGAKCADYQEDVLRALVRYKRVAVRAPHGTGKTAIAAWVILWGMVAFPDDTKIPTTASAWRQLDLYLWPEIRKWARKAKLEPRPVMLHTAMRLPDKEAFAVASDTPALIEGAHASNLIYVFDEAKAIPADTWDAAEGAFSTAGDDTAANAYALAISTPGETSGRFYDIHSKKPGLQDWHTIHITLEQAIKAGRISRQWAEQRRTQWGETSSVYQNRVLGEFADSGEDSVIPLSWVEAANGRWHECGGKGDGEPAYGVDPARFGTDKTAICRMTGRVVEKISYHAKEDTMKTAGRVAAVAGKSKVGVDVIGVGAGVYDRLKELGFNVTPVNVAEAAKNADGTPMTDKSGELQFVNLRSALWWLLREALDPAKADPIALPPDDTLTGDLTAPKWTYTSRGLIQVESKDDMRKRIGRSTDAADAVAIALHVATAREAPKGIFMASLYSDAERANFKPRGYWTRH